jgi:phosphoribosyl-dephospho-CoA transferase
MARKPKKDDRLAVLTEEERVAYVTRRASLENQFVILNALSDHVNKHIDEIREKYDLPRFFDIDLATGVVRRSEVTDESVVV